jgi:hypothetical protein
MLLPDFALSPNATHLSVYLCRYLYPCLPFYSISISPIISVVSLTPPRLLTIDCHSLLQLHLSSLVLSSTHIVLTVTGGVFTHKDYIVQLSSSASGEFLLEESLDKIKQVGLLCCCIVLMLVALTHRHQFGHLSGHPLPQSMSHFMNLTLILIDLSILLPLFTSLAPIYLSIYLSLYLSLSFSLYLYLFLTVFSSFLVCHTHSNPSFLLFLSHLSITFRTGVTNASLC